MSKRKLNIEDKKYIYYIKEDTSDCESSAIHIYSKILSNKSSFYITNEDHSSHLEIKPSSLKKILLKGQNDPIEYILFSFYKDILISQINNNKDNSHNNENEEHKEKDIKLNNHKNKLRSDKKKKQKENESIIINIPSTETINDDKEDHKINNENNYDIEIDLFNNKSNENLMKSDESQDNILCLLNNRIRITNDNLKCFYLSLFFCGMIYIINFLDALINKNQTIKCLFNIFSFPLSILLMYTGIYGYFKINKKIYDDKRCINLTYASFFTPFLSFIFSRISSDENVRKNIVMSIFINLITICFSGICGYILRELNNINNNKGLLFEKVNIA